ncbi:glycosyltransferase family 4 protein [Flavobacterium sp.]|uniref:glycosyltransferase family 4 protein n=1 Tax=Flavobacterium sp. TaxID=239 RepID=UPI0026066FD9|nr:glycosyltransferase family 4 protein [Flavobacterium sp.]
MKNQLHIAYLVSHYPHEAFGDDGGLGTSVYTLVEKIRRKDCYVSVFVYGQQKAFEIQEENLTIYSIADIDAKFFKFYCHRKHIEKFVKEKIKSTSIDILEAPDWTGITAFMHFNIPLIIRFHGSDAYFCHLEKRKQKLKNFLFEKLAIRHADAFIAPTSFAGELSKKIFNIQGKEIKTIHYGLAIENFHNPHPEQFEKGLILYIGTIIRKKGVLQLPGIFHLLQQQCPEAKLVLIGGDSYDIETGTKSTWALVRQLFQGDEEQSVTYLGKVPYQQVKEHIKRAHVCIFPTFAETLGMVTIESMALQKPVINSDIGWSQELIEDGVSGYLVHPENHELYAQRIQELFQNESLAETMGKAARKRVEEHFDIEKIVLQNIDFYKKILSRN